MFFRKEVVCSPLDGQIYDQSYGALASWISAKYLRPKCMHMIRQKFESGSHVKLPGFWRSELVTALTDVLQARDVTDKIASGDCISHEAGEGHGWILTGPANERRYLRWEASDRRKKCSAGAALAGVASVFRRLDFIRYIDALTGLKRIGTPRLEVRRFRPGFDYVTRQRASSVHIGDGRKTKDT